MRFSYILFIVLSIAMTLCSCKEKGGKYLDQGEIHYNIDYKGIFLVPKEVMPQTLVVSFKKNKILFEMVGLGNSGIMNLANPEKKIYDTYFSLFAKKFYYEAEPGELFPGFEAMGGMTIKKTAKTAMICGYNCKNAEVNIPGKENIYEIWYTNEIKIKNPNASTPFSQIDGVLMSFFFIMGSSELHFLAETVYNKELPDEIFERKENYIKVSREDITEFMNRMLNI